MARWNKEGIPHKGWRYVDVEDVCEGVVGDEERVYEQCQMCRNERIRYVHILQHPEFDGMIRVGCDCASKMTDDYVNPQQREKDLRNRVNRKRNFLKQGWRLNPRTGNPVLRYKGEIVTIMRSHYGTNYGIMYRGKPVWKYQGRYIYDLDTAKQAAFELFDEPHD